MATWQPGSAHEPGVVYINRDHPVLCKHVEEFQEQYPQHYEETIAAEVLQTYGRLAVAHVAHSEQMLRLTPRQNVERLRTDEALTMALLGMWQVEAPRWPPKMYHRWPVENVPGVGGHFRP